MLQLTGKEVVHSDILAWLLRPDANHGFSHQFLEQFLSRIAMSVPAAVENGQLDDEHDSLPTESVELFKCGTTGR